ncbi:MAG: Glutaredoxin-like protein YruB-family [Parcubacteria group bacterium]|nr:Glutaredoxin-like protein YruB-family [Parcubacteria group bacterium]
MTTNTHTVEIYSTPTCHFCHMAKDFFSTYDVPFTDHNVAADREKLSEMINKSGQMGVPVIVVDNKEIIVGFDRDHLVELLGISA